MSKKDREILDGLKNSIPAERENKEFEVQKELSEGDLDTVSGGECRCMCGLDRSCGGGGGGGTAAFEVDPS